MELGKIYELNITSYDMNGWGVASLDNKVIFVEKAMKAEVVLAKITNIHKKYAFAQTVKVLEASTERIESICPYYEGCGGCDLLHMNYQVECEIKEAKIKNSFAKINSLKNVKINPIIKNDKITGYRNKIIIPFSVDADNNVIYGFYAKMSHELISIDHCIISNQYVNEVVEFIRKYLSVMNIKIYNETTHTGIFKGVMIRNNYLNEMMVVLIVTTKIDFSGLVSYLEKDYPLVKSIYLNINPKLTNVMLGDKLIHLAGAKTLVEDILGLKFNVSAASFMQINHEAAQKLYNEAFKMANLTKNMNVIDAYCGMGSITLNLAKMVNYVYGIEVVPDAIINANHNKELNNIKNVTFICGKCEEEIAKLLPQNKIDVIFFDPPRKGCEKSFLEAIVNAQIPKLVYISCNIATACRDINYLLENNYQVVEVTPVDIFSRTNNVETVVTLSLRK